MGELLKEPLNIEKEQKALCSYIKGLMQDFYNTTGRHIESITIQSCIEENKWQVKEVQLLTDLQVPLFNA